MKFWKIFVTSLSIKFHFYAAVIIFDIFRRKRVLQCIQQIHLLIFLLSLCEMYFINHWKVYTISKLFPTFTWNKNFNNTTEFWVLISWVQIRKLSLETFITNLLLNNILHPRNNTMTSMLLNYVAAHVRLQRHSTTIGVIVHFSKNTPFFKSSI